MEATCWICGKEILKPISEKDKKLLDSLEYTMDDVERLTQKESKHLRKSLQQGND